MGARGEGRSSVGSLDALIGGTGEDASRPSEVCHQPLGPERSRSWLKRAEFGEKWRAAPPARYPSALLRGANTASNLR
jgi:hypothetical protein